MANVKRIYVEKKEDFAVKAKELKEDVIHYLGMDQITNVRVFIRYDVENLSEEIYQKACKTVFSEPPVDILYEETFDMPQGARVFSVEYLPGQFDQRADSAVQCVKFLKEDEEPVIKTAVTYLFEGNITDEEFEQIKAYCINPVDSRETDMVKPDTLITEFEEPEDVLVFDGFKDMAEDEFKKLYASLGLAMTFKDFLHIQKYYKEEENRDPSMTEIRVLDNYWSDHCRHTTFSTELTDVAFGEGYFKAPMEATYNNYLETREEIFKGRDDKFVCLMDLALMAMRKLKKDGKLADLEESEEINACSIVVPVEFEKEDGTTETEEWLVFFKNETHNHPTEIEPFGGAATCLGGAIRDPLSGRGYVYQAMRVTGAADPTVPVADTLKGKLSQKKLVRGAASGYSSYGNQIGLATGFVKEIYHPDYVAKRMEIGAVMGAAPRKNVIRETSDPGDIIILLGGRTGRDGCGGATGSSKVHTESSIETCGAEVQKGNAPTERKIQRLFRREEVSKLIKKCNDFGAGGVSVAIGELADGLVVDLDKVPKKYAGLDGTELAISESQERMAVVVEAKDVDAFKALADKENLEATVVARVTEEARLVMNWNGKAICDISREFLNSNGAPKSIAVAATKPDSYEKTVSDDFVAEYMALAADLNVCSKRGLSERFDSTIGAGTVLMPFGGKHQQTPIQAMVHKVSVEKKDTKTCSLMSWGYNPYIAEKSPYHSAYLAVVESVSKLVAAGAKFEDVYLTFQEYFERPRKEAARWGKPFAALLGAFKAQVELGIAAIGGKDSMSGSFEDLDVPPTLVSFAVTTEDIDNIISPEFKAADRKVVILRPDYDENGLPVTESLLKVYDKVYELVKAGKCAAAYTPTFGGVAEAVMKMSFGNEIGFAFDDNVDMKDIFGYNYGAFVLELTEDIEVGETLGVTLSENVIIYKDKAVDLDALLKTYEDKLEPVYSCNIEQGKGEIPVFSCNEKSTLAPAIKVAKPKVLIPVFPGTNCEFDTAKAMARAGAEPEIIVIKNLTAESITESVEYFAKQLKDAQMVFIPGGFSGGDEPDGSGKFITAFFRNGAVKEQVNELLKNRDGLMCGVCNGFQAIIKLGLVPFGEIIDTDETCPTLTFNTIARHQSRIVRTRIASTKSPWLSACEVGEIYDVPISHGEGKFLADEETIKRLAANGQIATQYVDLNGNPTADIRSNPNDSTCAIEGILSPDGRVFGKMGHSERWCDGLYKNVPGNYDIKMFRSAVDYFKL